MSNLATAALFVPQIQAPGPVAVQSEIMMQGVGSTLGYQGPSLVQVCIGVNPPALPTSLPKYAIDNVPCDVFPISRNSLGQVTAAHLVALKANGNGLPAIPGTGVITPILREANTSPTTSQVITLAGFAGIELTVDPSNSPVMVCRPFDPTFLGRVAERTTLDGKYLKQTITVSQFVPVGATQTTANQDTALVVYAVLTNRSDLPAATVDFMIANGAYDPTYNTLTNPDTTSPVAGSHGGHPNGQNIVSDGPFFFRSMRLALNSSTLRGVLFVPRPGSFQDPGTNSAGPFDVVAQPAEPPPSRGAVTQVNGLMPGDFFIRRFCVYQPQMFPVGSNPRALAVDIVDRRDFGWAIGEIGYMAGGYSPATHRVPDLSFLQYTSSSGTHSGWSAVYERGKKMETDALGDLVAPLGGTIYQQCGWMKPPPEHDSMPPGEYHVAFGGYTWPSNGEMKARLLWGDRYAERSHLAVINLRPDSHAERGWPMTDTAYARQGGGKFPTGFSGEGTVTMFVPPQHCLPQFTASTWNPPTVNADANRIETPTLGLPWNNLNTSLAAPEYCPYMGVLNWTNVAPGTGGGNGYPPSAVAYYGPLAWSHISKTTAHWRSNAYGIDDALSWLALEFQAHAYSFAAGRFDVTQVGTSGVVGNRFPYARQESNLLAFATEYKNYTPAQVGYWTTVVPNPPAVPGNGFQPPEPRSRINGWGALACHYAHANDAERQRYTLDQNGNGVGGAHDVRALIKTFYTHVTMPSGIMFAADSQLGAPNAYSYGDFYLSNLTGSIPSTFTGGDTPGQNWAHTVISQQAYGFAALQGLEHSMLRGTAYGGTFNNLAKFADNFAASVTHYTAQNFINFNTHLPVKRGTLGYLNHTPTELEYRSGSLFWMFMLTPNALSTNRRELFMLLAAWKANSLGGGINTDMRNAIRRMYDIPATGQWDAVVRQRLQSEFTFFTNTTGENLADHLVPLLALY